jgi:hypothetical protein
MSRYDGLIIPRSYSEYINKTDAATLQQALQLSGVLSGTVAAGDNKAVKSGAVNTALLNMNVPKRTGLTTYNNNNYAWYKLADISGSDKSCFFAICAGGNKLQQNGSIIILSFNTYKLNNTTIKVRVEGYRLRGTENSVPFTFSVGEDGVLYLQIRAIYGTSSATVFDILNNGIDNKGIVGYAAASVAAGFTSLQMQENEGFFIVNVTVPAA